MTNFEGANEVVNLEEPIDDSYEDGIETGPRILSGTFGPEMLEELDHRLRDEGYSVDTIEDQFELLDEDKADELERYLHLYDEAVNEEAIRNALDGIINIIK